MSASTGRPTALASRPSWGGEPRERRHGTLTTGRPPSREAPNSRLTTPPRATGSGAGPWLSSSSPPVVSPAKGSAPTIAPSRPKRDIEHEDGRLERRSCQVKLRYVFRSVYGVRSPPTSHSGANSNSYRRRGALRSVSASNRRRNSRWGREPSACSSWPGHGRCRALASPTGRSDHLVSKEMLTMVWQSEIPEFRRSPGPPLSP
jgi:hypothetical protein